MFELDECLRIAKKIKKKEDIILELKSRTMSPKNQIITDMPKGGGTQANDLENYLIKLEKYEAVKNKLQSQLNVKWNEALNKMQGSGITKDESIYLMKLRFYYGYAWKKCLSEMQDTYKESKWTINKCFNTYRSILHKTGW